MAVLLGGMCEAGMQCFGCTYQGVERGLENYGPVIHRYLVDSFRQAIVVFAILTIYPLCDEDVSQFKKQHNHQMYHLLTMLYS